MSTRVIIADDHKIVRDGLKALLSKEPDMVVLGEAENGRAAVELARKYSPHVVIMDISMPELNGVEAARQIIQDSPQIRVIALSMYSDRRYVAGMLKAGATGYLLKSCSSDEVVKAVREVVNGRTFMSTKIADIVMKDYATLLSASEATQLDLLTAREREVLQLIAEGLSTNDMALRLKVSVKTVSTHRQQILQKLKMSSVSELTLFALREGIINLDMRKGNPG